MGFRLHPRAIVVQQARHAFEVFLLELEAEYALTHGELTSLLSNSIANLAKYQIRGERHPNDPDKKGDEA